MSAAVIRRRGRPLLLLPAALALLLLAGCTESTRTTLSALRLALSPPVAAPPTREQVLARPYFQLQVERGEQRAVLVLGNVDGDREAWYSGDRRILFLRHGLLVKTWGLQGNLQGTRLPADSPFLHGLQHLAGPLDGSRSVDLSPGYRYGVAVQSRLTPGPMETLTVLGESHAVRRVDEHVSAAALAWQADNHYWVDPTDGLVWKSEQTLPTGERLVLTMLRPMRPDGAADADRAASASHGHAPAGSQMARDGTAAVSRPVGRRGRHAPATPAAAPRSGA